MTPMQGQGANMAMEDAESLPLLLLGMGKDEIRSVLAKVDAVRRPRAAKVLQGTCLQADETTMEERLANMDYNCGYNGVYEALKALEYSVDKSSVDRFGETWVYFCLKFEIFHPEHLRSSSCRVHN
ncbi:hypothetical protein NCS56_01243900 [Fusarium sp. Ph1]|nr:hypothetical protein NCS56_01243900 [Fusarium sp. Ph1]